MLSSRSHTALLKLLLDARVNLQTAEHMCDCEHAFGYAHDLEQIVYELDLLLISASNWEKRRRPPATRGT